MAASPGKGRPLPFQRPEGPAPVTAHVDQAQVARAQHDHRLLGGLAGSGSLLCPGQPLVGAGGEPRSSPAAMSPAIESARPSPSTDASTVCTCSCMSSAQITQRLAVLVSERALGLAVVQHHQPVTAGGGAGEPGRTRACGPGHPGRRATRAGRRLRGGRSRRSPHSRRRCTSCTTKLLGDQGRVQVPQETVGHCPQQGECPVRCTRGSKSRPTCRRACHRSLRTSPTVRVRLRMNPFGEVKNQRTHGASGWSGGPPPGSSSGAIGTRHW